MEKYTGTPGPQTLYLIHLVVKKEHLKQKHKQNLELSHVLNSKKCQLYIYCMSLPLLKQGGKCSWIQGEMKRIGENTKIGNPYYRLLNKKVKFNRAT